jgi:hypothetical protein
MIRRNSAPSPKTYTPEILIDAVFSSTRKMLILPRKICGMAYFPAKRLGKILRERLCSADVAGCGGEDAMFQPNQPFVETAQ